MRQTKPRLAKLGFALLAMMMPTTTIASVAAQRTLFVPSQYATIQRALDASGADDTILVAPGRYVETIRFPSQANGVRLLSAAGPYRTTINGAKATVAVVWNDWSSDCVIDGFTVTNGLQGGMTLRGNTTVQNCIVTGNLGSGITVLGSAVIRDNIIERNQGVNGGGIHFAASRTGFTVTGNLIADNIATRMGGGVYTDSAHTRFYANRFERNRAGMDGGGLADENFSYLELRSNVFVMNAAGRDGGGLSFTFDADMGDTTFLSNVAARNGGGFAFGSYGAVTIEDMILWGNSAPTGPNVYVTGSSRPTTLSIYESDVEGGPGSIGLGPNAYLSWGQGNYSGTAKVVIDAAIGDWHIPEVAKDRGFSWPAYPYDADGDPRVMGPEMDRGGDEFPTNLGASRLYVIGKAAPGSTIRIGVVAPSRSAPPVILGVSLSPSLRSPPVSIPGSGVLLLADPIGILPIGKIDGDGSAGLTIPLPANLPPLVVHFQALVSYQLTNVTTIWIR